MGNKGLAHEIIQDYARVKQELGRHPTRDEYLKNGKYTRKVIDECFGNWTVFLHASGIKYSQNDKNLR